MVASSRLRSSSLASRSRSLASRSRSCSARRPRNDRNRKVVGRATALSSVAALLATALRTLLGSLAESPPKRSVTSMPSESTIVIVASFLSASLTVQPLRVSPTFK